MKAQAMTDKEEYELRAYSALIYKEYGYQIGPLDPMMPFLYINHKEMQLNNKTNEAIVLVLKEALSKVNPQSIHFNQSGEAWDFQWGITLRWIIVSVLIVVSSYSGVWYWSLRSEIEKARRIVQESALGIELLKRAELDEQGRFYIDFVSSNRKSPEPLTEYKKRDANTIRVYLSVPSRSK